MAKGSPSRSHGAGMKPGKTQPIRQIRAGEPGFPGLGKLSHHHESLCPPPHPTRRLASESDTKEGPGVSWSPPRGNPGILEPGVREEGEPAQGTRGGEGTRCWPPTADAPAAPWAPPKCPARAGRRDLLQSTLVLLIFQPLGCSIEMAHFILSTATQAGTISTPTLQMREMRHKKGRGWPELTQTP